MDDQRSEPAQAHEAAFVRSFVSKEKRERWLEGLGHPKRRRKLLATLAHRPPFDADGPFVRRLEVDSVEGVLRMLRALGAGSRCHVLSESTRLDGQDLAVDAALSEVLGRGIGTVLSIEPGRIAYYEGEGPSDRYLLVREAR